MKKTTDNYATGIKDISYNTTSNNLEIFPNPVHNELAVSTAKRSVAKIFNSSGQLMISQKMDSGNNKIAVGQLVKGIYILEVYDGGS